MKAQHSSAPGGDRWIEVLNRRIKKLDEREPPETDAGRQRQQRIEQHAEEMRARKHPGPLRRRPDPKSIWKLAEVRCRPAPVVDTSHASELAELAGALVEMRRAGLFEAVYCEAEQFRALFPGQEFARLMSMDSARLLVAEWKAEQAAKVKIAGLRSKNISLKKCS